MIHGTAAPPLPGAEGGRASDAIGAITVDGLETGSDNSGACSSGR